MTVDEIKPIANEILARYLTESGYERVEVRAGYNQSDEPSLFVIAHMKPGSGVTGGKESNAANAALRWRLLELGEERFPYLSISIIRTMKFSVTKTRMIGTWKRGRNAAPRQSPRLRSA